MADRSSSSCAALGPACPLPASSRSGSLLLLHPPALVAQTSDEVSTSEAVDGRPHHAAGSSSLASSSSELLSEPLGGQFVRAKSRLCARRCALTRPRKASADSRRGAVGKGQYSSSLLSEVSLSVSLTSLAPRLLQWIEACIVAAAGEWDEAAGETSSAAPQSRERA